MEVLRSGITTGITPQRYGISNGLGASLFRCVAWLKPYRRVLIGNCTEVGVRSNLADYASRLARIASAVCAC